MLDFGDLACSSVASASLSLVYFLRNCNSDIMWNLLLCSLSLEKNMADSVSTYLSHLNCRINSEDFASWVSFCLLRMTSVWTVIDRKKKTLWHMFTSRPATCQHKKKVLIGEAQFSLTIWHTCQSSFEQNIYFIIWRGLHDILGDNWSRNRAAQPSFICWCLATTWILSLLWAVYYQLVINLR